MSGREDHSIASIIAGQVRWKALMGNQWRIGERARGGSRRGGSRRGREALANKTSMRPGQEERRRSRLSILRVEWLAKPEGQGGARGARARGGRSEIISGGRDGMGLGIRTGHPGLRTGTTHRVHRAGPAAPSRR
jgi:hypothetical protein